MQIDVKKTNDMLMRLSPVDRIKWGADNFGEGVLSTTSGGRTSRIIPDLIQKALGRSVPTIFVDTGHYSKETYLFIDKMEKDGIDIMYYNSSMSRKRMESLYGKLWEESGENFDKFLSITKHEPLNRAFSNLNATLWIRGIMGFQTKERKEANIFEYRNGLYRLHPIVDWTHKQAKEYLDKNNLPVNNRHFDITKGSSGKSECKIGEIGGFNAGGGI